MTPCNFKVKENYVSWTKLEMKGVIIATPPLCEDVNVRGTYHSQVVNCTINFQITWTFWNVALMMRLLLLNSVPYLCFEVCERQFKLTSNEFAMFLRVCKTGNVSSFLSPLYGTLKILINQKNYNVIFESCDSLVSLTNVVSDISNFKRLRPNNSTQKPVTKQKSALSASMFLWKQLTQLASEV